MLFVFQIIVWCTFLVFATLVSIAHDQFQLQIFSLWFISIV